MYIKSSFFVGIEPKLKPPYQIFSLTVCDLALYDALTVAERRISASVNSMKRKMLPTVINATKDYLAGYPGTRGGLIGCEK
ncbi:MAG: hypothetical protein A3F68_06395 [Acidobacteria bacterium RIFCSPLOWO2_12_FULL_54_10]|nr:MAG: hypothetical protein A3F68_06395 [Acidobacteria bacterium RIFCSPLOWO2_12_FULL_54_10]